MTYEITIGKNGLNETMIAEIARQLKARGQVKIKLLKSAIGEMSRQEIDERFSNLTGPLSALLHHTVVLEKRIGNTATYRKTEERI